MEWRCFYSKQMRTQDTNREALSVHQLFGTGDDLRDAHRIACILGHLFRVMARSWHLGVQMEVFQIQVREHTIAKVIVTF